MEFLVAVVGLAVLACLCAAICALLLVNRRLRGRLRYDADHDPVTGMLNEQGFDRAARRVMDSAATAVALRIDIDTRGVLGGACAEKLLRTAAARIRSVLGAGSLLARVDGGCFAGWLVEHDVGEAHALAGTLADELAVPYPMDCRDVGAAAVVGYASGGTAIDEPCATALIRRAEMALRRARDSGSRVGSYCPGVEQAVERRLRLAGEFRRAVRSGDLLVHYQPLLDLASKRVRSVETLARWRHPQFGDLEPDEFVPCIESSDLVDVLTLFMLEQALAAVRGWLDRGIRLSASVNLSARTLSDNDFPERVAGELGRHRVPSELLIFELTESGVMADDETLPVLRKLRELGCRLALDDFGTGYSSLAYLRALPIDEVKIDKSFVLGVSSDRGDEAVVRSVIDLGRSLGLDVVAEGVEDDATLLALEELGCNAVQGYLIARPLPALRFDAWLGERTAPFEQSGVAAAPRFVG
jgi:predicted signal transduction protein with EAL and GGDEF domain